MTPAEGSNDPNHDLPPFGDYHIAAAGAWRLISRSSSIDVRVPPASGGSRYRAKRVASALVGKPSLSVSTSGSQSSIRTSVSKSSTSPIPFPSPSPSPSFPPVTARLPPFASLGAHIPAQPQRTASDPAKVDSLFRVELVQQPEGKPVGEPGRGEYPRHRRSQSFGSGVGSRKEGGAVRSHRESFEKRGYPSDQQSSSFSSSPGTIFSQRSQTSRTLSTTSSQTSSTSVASKLFDPAPPPRPRHWQPISFDQQRLPRRLPSEGPSPLPIRPIDSPPHNARRPSTSSSVDSLHAPRGRLTADRASLDVFPHGRAPTSNPSPQRHTSNSRPFPLPSLPVTRPSLDFTRPSPPPPLQLRKRASARILNAFFPGSLSSASSESDLTASTYRDTASRRDKFGSLNSLRAVASPPQLSPVLAKPVSPTTKLHPGIFSLDLTHSDDGYPFPLATPPVASASTPRTPTFPVPPPPPSPTAGSWSSGKSKGRKRALTLSKAETGDKNVKQGFLQHFLKLKRSSPSLSAKANASSRSSTPPPPTPPLPRQESIPIPSLSEHWTSRSSAETSPAPKASRPPSVERSRPTNPPISFYNNPRQNYSHDGSSAHSLYATSIGSSPGRPTPSGFTPHSPPRNPPDSYPRRPTRSTSSKSWSEDGHGSSVPSVPLPTDYGAAIASFESLRQSLPARGAAGTTATGLGGTDDDNSDSERPTPLRPAPRRAGRGSSRAGVSPGRPSTAPGPRGGSTPPALASRIPPRSDLEVPAFASRQLPMSLGRAGGESALSAVGAPAGDGPTTDVLEPEPAPRRRNSLSSKIF